MLKLPYLLSFMAASVSSILFPKPLGPYDVYRKTTKLVDTSRTDPFSPNQEYRAVLTTIFTPTICSTPLKPRPYIPAATAKFYTDLFTTYGLTIPDGALTSLQLQTCPDPPGPDSRTQPSKFPIIIFSPGLGTTRLFYAILAQSLASTGYIVISIDHPYDTEFLEFPDRTVVTAANITDDLVPLDVDTRARDMSFVLDQLRLGAMGVRVRRTADVAVLGHSLGGAAAAEAMRQDSRFRAGINLDGSMYGPVVRQGPGDDERPFLLFGHENKTHVTDPSWVEFINSWGRGGVVELELEKAEHYAFSDLPSLLDLLGLDGRQVPAVKGMIGSLSGERALEVVRGVIEGFLEDRFCQGSPERLLNYLELFTEVEVVERC
ncbi:PAF acetylhydrolase family protein [Aspergillus undulatus]|uniref:PAF acetylhydrolase family protein n=1 Tax=Aspergillus undulatus TaxID=1810928 RepID=UPI003CCD4AF8